MTPEDLPTFALANFTKRGNSYSADAQRLAPNGGAFAACFSIGGKCTHGFRVVIRGVPRLFMLKPSRRQDSSWTFVQVEGGDRTIRVFDN